MTTASEIQRILDQHPQLHFYGYGPLGKDAMPGDRDELAGTESVAVITKVVAWLQENIVPTRTINPRHSSYSMKHLAERAIGEYVGGGQLIVAALLCGYPMGDKGYSRSFGMSNRSIQAVYAAQNPPLYPRRPAKRRSHRKDYNENATT